MESTTVINIILYVLLGWFLFTRFAPVRGLINLTEQEFASHLSKGVLLDVREPHEFQGGYIQGAKNIPLSQLKARIGEIPKERPVLLYCRSGMRSKQAAKVLAKSGYSDLAHLKGGMMAWKGKTRK
ncbi:rhodanese-like domain-containing protein [Ammoniphilus sp. CFH 90114]|uniref:rhodanese-like domain-containing protein n=1 Tax=Ammoniphilus sp. CFH 90114 TaxID=2493665 RepID=UPI00100DA8B5|nr:rhodanese-like domain-containing protein [Ammoniphilus sp. CFH 90114]RXT07919.1 rhodanese-like domain-containing protein [Ammoniphilus sp. CFH 90114]